jgi:Uma2 family endonuclease
MSALVTKPIIYPESDGQPMAENTLQFEWIVMVKCGLEAVFRNREDVFVAGDLFWYPVEGDPYARMAPDAMVVFGRPKGHRGSYRQWEEGGIAPQVVFEILSPSNRPMEMTRKFEFYQQYGVEEYYLYDPMPGQIELAGYLRDGDVLREIPDMNGFVSPRLGVKFEMTSDGLRILAPNGEPFASHLAWVERAEAAEAALKREREKDEEIRQLKAQLHQARPNPS